MTKPFLRALALPALALIAACSSTDDVAQSSASTVELSVTDFSLTDTEGNTHTLSDYVADGKTVVLVITAKNAVSDLKSTLPSPPVTPCAAPQLPKEIELTASFEKAALQINKPFEPFCGTGDDFTIRSLAGL